MQFSGSRQPKTSWILRTVTDQPQCLHAKMENQYKNFPVKESMEIIKISQSPLGRIFGIKLNCDFKGLGLTQR